MKIAQIMSVDPLSVEASDTLADAIGLMTERGVRHLPVVRDGRVVGIVSDRDLLESTGWMWDEERGKAPAVVGDVLQPEPMTLGPDDSVATLARRLVEWGVGCAPVVVDGALRGIATEIDVLEAFVAYCGNGHPPPDPVPVEQRMSVDPLTLEVTATAQEAFDLMRGNAVRHLPVVEDLTVVGLVSDRDLRAMLGRAMPGNTPVREFMATEVETVSPDDDLTLVAHTLAAHKIGALPVVDGDALVGVISTTDVLDHCASVLG